MRKTAQIFKNKKLAIAIALLILFFPAYAMAQETIRTITVVPPSVEHQLDPGKTAEGVMKIINDGNEPLTFTATVQDYIVEDTLGTPKMLPENLPSNRFSAANWIGFTPSTFTVKPHDKAIINYYVQVPLDARPGGHYAAIVFKPSNTLGVTGTGATVDTQVGTLFYVNVNGPINEYSVISKFFTDFLHEYGPVTLLTQIRNLGDLHVKPDATITVSNLFGQKSTYKLDQFNVFPTAGRDYKNEVGGKFMFGPYKAELSGLYGKNKNLPLLATVSFWVFPWRIALLVILIIVAAILGTKYWKESKRHKHHKNLEEVV